MNLKKILLTAALSGGVISTSAFAVTADAHKKVAKAVQIDPPAVTKVVSPTNLSRRHGDTVLVHIALDANGRPQKVDILSRGDEAIAKNLKSAISQWEFKPAMKDGVAVPSKVIVPIELVEA